MDTLREMPVRASVVIATYNRPDYLELALLGYATQTCMDFEVLIADDGSGEETREVIERCQKALPFRIRHIWQEDDGFRKARVLNQCVLESVGSSLIFADGDCVPPQNYIEHHLDQLSPNTFVAGGFVRMSEETTATVSRERIQAGDFDGLETPVQRRARLRMHRKNLFYRLLGHKRKPKFWGLNFSVDRDSFFRVNGFDMNYTGSGRDDSDLRNRMRLGGIKGISRWDSSVVFHLYHPYHSGRGKWREQNDYYKRKDLAPRSPLGLEELAKDKSIDLEGAWKPSERDTQADRRVNNSA